MVDPVQKPICYLMSVYDDPQGMMRTLDSLFADEALADIVIVDDGSRYPLGLPSAPPDYFLMLLRNERNGVIVDALNRGLHWILAQHYTYVARIDAGDTVIKGRLRAQMDFLAAHPDIAILGTQMQAIDAADSRPLFAVSNPVEPRHAKKMLAVRNVLAQPSVMMRTDIFRRHGFYNPAYRYAEDYELWRRVARHHNVANLPQVFVHKEIKPDQMTARYRHRSILSRLRAQIRYFNPLCGYSWYGIARSVASLFVPRSVLMQWKARHAL